MKELAYHALVTPSTFLMEDVIPRAKFAAFAKEYAQRISAETKLKGRPLTQDEKDDIARDQMKFVEDRFGEVNWKNMWLHKTNKTLLQFFFRSFTWVAGSWKAMTKVGAEFAKTTFLTAENAIKWGWLVGVKGGEYSFKGNQYTMSDKGWWGLMAIATHLATAQMIAMAVKMAFYGTGGDDDEWQEDDESVKWYVKRMFPRIDPRDNTKRLTFGSYPSEVFKHLSHLGVIGNDPHFSKIWTGRMNGLVTTAVETLWNNETLEGETIRNTDDPILKQSYDVTKHVLSKAFVPMSFSGFAKSIQDGETGTASALRLAGFTTAPASTMRSAAANFAFQLSRREYKGKETTSEEAAIKKEHKAAMQKLMRGDNSDVMQLRASGKMSDRQYEILLSRLPYVNGMNNPKYDDQLSQALNRLPVKSALKVYEVMTDTEKDAHAKEITKKINNMKLRKDQPKELQDLYIARWNEMKNA